MKMVLFVLFVFLFHASSGTSLSLKDFGAINFGTDFASAKQNSLALQNALKASSVQQLPVVVNADEV